MLNHIVIMGRLTRDPEIRRTGTGIAVASFSVAVERDFGKNENSEKETDFIDCVAWRTTGEFVSKYFTKGSMAVVSGRLQMRDWTDRDGNKRTSAEVVLEARDVLDRLGLAAPEEKNAQEPPALDEEEQKIVQCLSREAQSFDELAVLSGFLAPKLNSLLTRLELKGIIDQSAGRVYAMKR